MSQTQWTWDLPSPFIMTVSAGFEHTDRLGHVNNTVYLQWMEQAAWLHITDLGAPWSAWQQANRAMATVDTHIHYHAAASSGSLLKVATWLTKANRLHASRHFQIIRTSDGATLVTADIDYTCIAISTGKPARMPGFMANAHQAGVNQPTSP